MTSLPRGRTIFRVLLVWVITAASLQLFADLIPGIHVARWQAAFLGAAIICLLNALIWPLFIRVALPFMVLTFGIGALISTAS
jgi:putative membrane protein